MPTVDLKYVLILSMFLAILGFLVGAGSQFTDLGLTAAQTKAVIALCVLLLGMGNAVNSVLVAFGMTSSGRLANIQSVPLPLKLDNIVANNPTEIKSIVTTQALADATDSEKIVGPPAATGQH